MVQDMLYFQPVGGEFSMQEAQIVGIHTAFDAHERQEALIPKGLRKGSL